MQEKPSSSSDDRQRSRRYKVGDMVCHRNGRGSVFQVVEVLQSVDPGHPDLYGCVQVHRYIGSDLRLADDEEEDSEAS